MQLITLGSGSSGNTYLLNSDNECLILDAGINPRYVKEALNYDISNIVGVCVTHSHSDHVKYASDYEMMGIPVFKPYEKHFKRYFMGGFEIYPFDLVHNVPCYGFYIKHKDIENGLIYATDTCYVPYRFRNIGHMLIECNYSKENVDKSAFKYEHELKDHMEKETCKEFIRTNVSDSLKTVLLCHLSKNSIEPLQVVDEVKKIANKANVDVARKGLVVELTDKCPFE